LLDVVLDHLSTVKELLEDVFTTDLTESCNAHLLDGLLEELNPVGSPDGVYDPEVHDRIDGDLDVILSQDSLPRHIQNLCSHVYC
jgi:hypothetical protein